MSPHFFRRQVVGDRSLVTYAAGYLLLLLSCCVTAAVQRWRIIAAMLTSFLHRGSRSECNISV